MTFILGLVLLLVIQVISAANLIISVAILIERRPDKNWIPESSRMRRGVFCGSFAQKVRLTSETIRTGSDSDRMQPLNFHEIDK